MLHPILQLQHIQEIIKIIFKNEFNINTKQARYFMKKLFVYFLAFSKIIFPSQDNVITSQVTWNPYNTDIKRPSDSDIASTKNLLILVKKIMRWDNNSNRKFIASSKNSSSMKELHVLFYAKEDHSPINIIYRVDNTKNEIDFENKSIWSYIKNTDSSNTDDTKTEEAIHALFQEYSNIEGTSSATKEHLKLLEELFNVRRSTTADFCAIKSSRTLQRLQKSPEQMPITTKERIIDIGLTRTRFMPQRRERIEQTTNNDFSNDYVGTPYSIINKPKTIPFESSSQEPSK